MASVASPTPSLSINPHITCNDAARTIEFYKQAFGATEKFERWVDPKGKVGHAELQLGSSTLFVADANDEWDRTSPNKEDNAAVGLFLDVVDLEETMRRAIKSGGEVIQNISELRPYGCKDAMVRDPAGHVWIVSQQVKNPSEAEMKVARTKFRETGCF